MSNSKAPSHSPMTFTFTPTFAQQYRAILTMQVQSRGLLLVNLLFPASGVVLLLLVFGRLHRAPSLWEWTIVALSLGFTPLLTAQNLFLSLAKTPPSAVQRPTFSMNPGKPLTSFAGFCIARRERGLGSYSRRRDVLPAASRG